MKILGINGVGNDGKDNIDVLGKLLENYGHEYVDANYRITRLFRFQTYDTGRQFEDAQYIGHNYFEEDMVVIAHSRGGLVAWRMLELGYRFKAVFLFRPAINRDFILPLNQPWVHCIYNPEDKAIKWGSRLPFNDFGNAGRYGMDDPSITNWQAPCLNPLSNGYGYKKTEFWKHSDDFLKPQVSKWAGKIHKKLMIVRSLSDG